jgi:hypothetical protein
MTREEMREKFNDWLNELPNEPVLLKILKNWKVKTDNREQRVKN